MKVTLVFMEKDMESFLEMANAYGCVGNEVKGFWASENAKLNWSISVFIENQNIFED